MTTLTQLSYNYVEGSIYLLWTPPNDNGSPITQYTLYKDVGSGVYYPIYIGAATYYNDTNLIGGQAYNYEIKATNAAGDSAMSSVFTGVAGAPPNQVSNM